MILLFPGIVAAIIREASSDWQRSQRTSSIGTLPSQQQDMNDRARLLGQLKIDRGADEAPAPDRRWWWLAAAVLLAALAALAFFLARDSRVPVQEAVARAQAGAAGGASMLDASGYVVARRQATVSAKITGKLRDLYIEEGQRVAAGEVMARLDDSNARASLAQAQANLAQAQSALDNARPLYERAQALAKAGASSEEALQTARASFDAQRNAVAVARANLQIAQRNLDDTVVRAPFTGVVTTKAAQPGEIVSPMSAGGGFTRTGIGTLVDMDSLEVEVDVNESFINRVQGGAPASVRLNAYPDWEIPAEVIAVIPTADRAKATVKVRVGFKTRDPRILPEMGARVAFLSEAPKPGAAPKQGVLLPAAAVQREAGKTDTGVVYLIVEDHVERRAVRLGSSADPTQQLVLAGLTANQRVAIGDFSRLHDGVRIKLQDAP